MYTLESKSFQDALAIDLLLYAHASSCQHGQTSVAQLLRLHVSVFLGILGLEAKRIESNVAWVIILTKGEEWSKSRLDPAFGSAEGLDDVDGEEEREKDSSRNLRYLVVGNGVVNIHPVRDRRR